MPAAAVTADKGGSAAPTTTAIPMFTAPAISPLMQAIAMASLAETLRVRLLSIAQQRQAPAMRRAPGDTEILPGVQESTSPPATMSAMPDAIRRSKFSPNTNHARPAVNTASRLSSRALTDAAVVVSPSMSDMGPSTPPNKIAAANQPISDWAGQANCSADLLPSAAPRNNSPAPSPSPEPAYSKPASSTG